MATTLYLRVNSVSRLKQLLKESVRKASRQVQIVISGIKRFQDGGTHGSMNFFALCVFLIKFPFAVLASLFAVSVPGPILHQSHQTRLITGVTGCSTQCRRNTIAVRTDCDSLLVSTSKTIALFFDCDGYPSIP